MSWLVWHDIWPNLTAGDPPQAMAPLADGNRPIEYQVGLFDKYGHRTGTAWSTYRHNPGSTPTREDHINFTALPLVGPTFIEIEFEYTLEAELDAFHLKVWSNALPRSNSVTQAPLRVDGERFASVFGFSVRLGAAVETFKISGADAGLVGDAFRPFGRMVGLHVGQSWRMQVVNPISAVTGLGHRFATVLVRVTGREGIADSQGRRVECFVVEARNAKAWVDDTGRVIVQEVDLPVQGRITLRDEPFDESLLSAAKAKWRQR